MIPDLLDEAFTALGTQRLHAGRIPADDAGTLPEVGFYHPRGAHRLQVIGSAAEAARLAGPPWPAAAPRAIVVATDAPKDPWLQLAQSLDLACHASPFPAQATVDCLRRLLVERAAPRQTVHATLVEVLGLGVLLLGASGAGKSELALELVARGHRLVADDAVELSSPSPACLLGTCPIPLYGFMEVHGLGVLDLRAAYGERAITPRARIDLAVRIDAGNTVDDPMERVTGRRRPLTLLDTTIPEIVLPVRLGHNAVMVEVACRDHWLRCGGYVACDAFTRAQDRRAAGVPPA